MSWFSNTFSAHNLFGSNSVFHQVVSSPVADVVIGATVSAAGSLVGAPMLGPLAVAGLKAGDAAQAKKDAQDKLTSAIKSNNQAQINSAKNQLNSINVPQQAGLGALLGGIGAGIVYPFTFLNKK